MLKQKAKISVFFLIIIIFFGLILTNAPKISNNTPNENDDNILSQITAPKSSAVPVKQIWKDPIGPALTMVDISEDGKYIASIHSSNVTLKDWNNKTLWTYRAGIGSFNDVSISGDGQYIVACTGETWVCLLNNSANGKYSKTAIWTWWWGSPSQIYCDLSNDGTKICIAVSNNLYLFNNSYESGVKDWIWNYNFGSGLNSIAMSSDGQYIAVGASDGYVYLFNTTKTTPKLYEWRFDTSASINYVDISADSNYIVAGNNDNEVYLLNNTMQVPKEEMWNYTCPSNNLLAALDISAQGDQILVGYNPIITPAGTICQFNNTFSSGNKIPEWSYTYAVGESIKDFDISSDGKYIVAGYSHMSIGQDSVVLLNTTNKPKFKLWSSVNVNDANMLSVAISGNGEYFVSGEATQDKIYLFYHDMPKIPTTEFQKLWDYSTAANVVDLDISKNGKYIAAINSTKVYLFSQSNNQTLWSYQAGIGSFNDVSISGDGQYTVACTGETWVCLLNNSVELPKTAMWTWWWGSPSPIYCDISAIGDKIAVAVSNNVYLFDNSYESGVKDWIWNYNFGSGLNSIAMSSDGQYIVVGASDGYIYLFNTTKTTPKLYEWRFDTSASVNYVDISADSNYIVAGNTDNEVYLLNNTTQVPKEEMWNYSITTGNLNDIAISDIGNHIIVGDDSGYFYVLNNTFSTEKEPEWNNTRSPAREVKSVDISSDGKYIIVGYSTTYSPDWGLVQLFDTSAADPDEPIRWDLSKSVSSVAISGLGDYIAVATLNPHIHLYYHFVYIPPSTELQKLWEYDNINTVNDLDVSKTGEYVAASIGGNLTLFDKSSNATIWTYQFPFAGADEVAISYDGTYIVGTDDSQVFLFNNTAFGAPWNPKEMWVYPSAPSAGDFHIDISEDGEIIVVGDITGTVLLFNNSFSSNKKPEWSILVSAPWDVAISPDGKYIAVGTGTSIQFYNTSNPTTYEWSFDTTHNIMEIDIGYDIFNNIYYIATYNQENEVYLLNNTIKNPKTVIWNYTVTGATVKDIVISDIGNYIIVGDDSGYFYVLNNTFSTEKEPEWNNTRSPDREVKTVDISSDGKYLIVGYSTTYYLDWGLVQLFDTSAADPDEPIWWDLSKNVTKVAISGFGGYIAVATLNPHIHFYYHYVYIPPVRRVIISGGDDDDDDDEKPIVIPFGNYYLIVIPISVISLIILKKRKVILKEK